MPFFVDSTRSPAILRITFTDAWPPLDEQQVWRTASVKAGILTPLTRALIDIRALKVLPTSTDLDGFANAAIGDGGWPLRRGYLTTPGLQFGVARQFQMMVPAGISIDVFTNEEAAENWLTLAAPQ